MHPLGYLAPLALLLLAGRKQESGTSAPSGVKVPGTKVVRSTTPSIVDVRSEASIPGFASHVGDVLSAVDYVPPRPRKPRDGGGDDGDVPGDFVPDDSGGVMYHGKEYRAEDFAEDDERNDRTANTLDDLGDVFDGTGVLEPVGTWFHNQAKNVRGEGDSKVVPPPTEDDFEDCEDKYGDGACGFGSFNGTW